MRRKRKNNYRGNRTIRGCIVITSDECNDNPDKMIRRFTKKVKNDGIIEEYRDRMTYKKPSEQRRLKEAAKRKKIEKANKERKTLFNPRDKNRLGIRRR